ncbi:MAG: PilZ domain-containing protein [Sedimentisphaerales bacterium]|nr:PilZ domain-containing protein [Sedimentisphaerales bacterium]
MLLSILAYLKPVLETASTPYDRFRAMRGMRYGSGWDMANNKWFVLVGASLILVLTIVLLTVRRWRLQRQEQNLALEFDEECYRRGLTAEEHEILTGIVERSGLKRRNSIFTMVVAFDRGASRLMQEQFAQGKSIVERKRLSSTVNGIKDKLGLTVTTRNYGIRQNRSDKGISSRTIPEGKLVTIALAGKTENQRIEGVVVKNDDFEIVVRTAVPLFSPPGQAWNVRYQMGSATWEFDGLTMACGPEGLELSHSDNIHFLNRRRFLRANVRRRALVARFPMVVKEADGQDMMPEFLEGTVTEISGPGLRIRCDLEVDHGQRVLVIFELEKGRIIQDIGEVRGSRDTAVTRSIGVELIGLSDAGVNEMVRVTNRIASQQGADLEEGSEDLIMTGGATHG